MASLYVHIPFCASICAYCDFPKVVYKKEWAFSYLKALFDELDAYKGNRYKTIYVGGGTPTALDDEDFASLIEKLAEYKDEECEWSVESNPDSLTDYKLMTMARYGVNRLSIGIESSSSRLLSIMGRSHDFRLATDAVKRAKKHGFTNINADMIYALEEESEEETKRDIDAFLSLSLPHYSVYSLIVEPGTRFYLDKKKEADEELAAKEYELILSEFRKRGYRRYEVSNFALPGYECQHNLVYWKDEEYDAVGLGAAGYRDNIRYRNTLNLSSYIKGNYLGSKEIVTKKDDIEYFFLTNLRLEEGFSLDEFSRRFGFSFEEEYASELAENIRNGLLINKEGRIRPTDKGMLLLDRILLLLYR